MNGLIFTIIIVIVSLGVGALITWLIGRQVTRRYKHLHGLTIDLSPHVIISPNELKLSGKLELIFDKKPIECLACYELRVTNMREADITTNFSVPRKPGDPPAPRIDFQGFRILGFTTVIPDDSKFYIALASANYGKTVYLNVNRIKGKITAIFRIVGTPTGPIDAMKASFFAGFIENTNVAGLGLLEGQIVSK